MKQHTYTQSYIRALHSIVFPQIIRLIIWRIKSGDLLKFLVVVKLSLSKWSVSKECRVTSQNSIFAMDIQLSRNNILYIISGQKIDVVFNILSSVVTLRFPDAWMVSHSNEISFHRSPRHRVCWRWDTDMIKNALSLLVLRKYIDYW